MECNLINYNLMKNTRDGHVREQCFSVAEVRVALGIRVSYTTRNLVQNDE